MLILFLIIAKMKIQICVHWKHNSEIEGQQSVRPSMLIFKYWHLCTLLININLFFPLRSVHYFIKKGTVQWERKNPLPTTTRNRKKKNKGHMRGATVPPILANNMTAMAVLSITRYKYKYLNRSYKNFKFKHCHCCMFSMYYCLYLEWYHRL